MAKNCWICNKKLGLVEASFVKMNHVSENISLCEICNTQINKLDECNEKDALESEFNNLKGYLSIRTNDSAAFQFIDWYKEKREEEIVQKHDNYEQIMIDKNDLPEEKYVSDDSRKAILEDIAKYKKHDNCLFDITGCRGRAIKVYEKHIVITTDVTLGSVLTNNATDGEKTIFYKDIIGIQYKRPGFTIGYLQLETAAGQMNNLKSNAFSENTFTFENNVAEIEDMKEYIQMRVSMYKE